MSDPERRAPVQKSWDAETHREYPGGTISWADHLVVWEAYDKKWRCGQSAERLAERCGFCHLEIIDLVGALPASFVPTPGAALPYRQVGRSRL